MKTPAALSLVLFVVLVSGCAEPNSISVDAEASQESIDIGSTEAMASTDEQTDSAVDQEANGSSEGDVSQDPATGGNVWDATATPVTDITQTVLAENEFNEPPPEGVIFAGFDLTMTLTEASESSASPGIDYTPKLEGATQIYDAFTLASGCGVTPNEFDGFAELKAGGSVTGTVCIPIPADELSSVQIVLDPFLGDRVIVPTG